MPRYEGKLTEQQERRVTRYLRDAGAQLAGLSPPEREAALSRLNARIDSELARFPKGMDDAGLDKMLARCGSPSSQAARLIPAKNPAAARPFVAWPDRVWLGVCGGIAQRLDIDANIVRLIAVLLGLVLPLLPLLLVAYLALYFWDYFSAERPNIDPIEPINLAKTLASTFGVAIALHVGTRVLLLFITHAYQSVTEQPLALERRWNWIAYDAGTWLFWVLAIGLPLAALSALPVPKAWAGTLKKTVQAGLALYAVWLCFGLASVLTGIILHSVEDFSGTAGTDALFSLVR